MLNLIEKIIDKFIAKISFLNRNNSPSYNRKQENYLGDNIGRDKIIVYNNREDDSRLKDKIKSDQKRLEHHRQISDYFKKLGILKTTDAGVDFNLITPMPANINPKKDYTVWRSVIVITTRPIELVKIVFRKNGNTHSDDIENYRLYIDGILVGKENNSSIDNCMIFDMMYEPIILKTGTRVIELMADIKDLAAGKNFSFSLAEEEIYLIDPVNNIRIRPTQNGIKFTELTSGEQKIN